MEPLLDTKSVCEVLGISRTTLYRLIERGSLRAHLIAKAWKFRPADIEAYLDRISVGA